jgi:carboxypeptidase A4
MFTTLPLSLKIVINKLTSNAPGIVVLYQSSGNGRDYLTDVGKAQFGWGIELRDTQYGFVLPPEQILPSGIEVWEGLKYAWSQF